MTAAAKPRIVIAGADVTEHVAAMFDALIGSLDWGSGFLDAETIEAILTVAELAGFTVPESHAVDPPGLEPYAKPAFLGTSEEHRAGKFRDAERAHFKDYNERRAKAITDWQAQVRAKARAMATEGDE